MERKIKPVSNNMDQYDAYKKQLDRYKKAMKEGFYYEALIIDYALIEDRLRSYLYHMGLLKDCSRVKVWTEPKIQLLPIICSYIDPEKEKPDFSISGITKKMKLVRCILSWANSTDYDEFDSKYLKNMKQQCRLTDINKTLDIFKKIIEWKGYRNEVLHNLIIKNSLEPDAKLIEQIRLGMEYSRDLDEQLRILKKGNKIRKALGLKLD